ncbi:MAG: hypothetical protein JEZ07_12390 [Phycisphaerae bacterium]|nr:hypothetical protein [Phycisphaerae bacterium]
MARLWRVFTLILSLSVSSLLAQEVEKEILPELFQQAQTNMEAGNLAQAEQDYLAFANNNPEHELACEALKRVAFSYRSQGRYEGITAIFEKMVNEHSGNADMPAKLVNLVDLCVHHNQYQKGIKICEYLVNRGVVDTNTLAGFKLLSHMYEILNDTKMADHYLQRMLSECQESPHLANYVGYMGNWCNMFNKCHRAMKYYELILKDPKLYGRNLSVYPNVTKCYLKLGEVKTAEKLLETYITEFSEAEGFTKNLNAIGNAYYKDGYYTQAVTAHKHLVDNFPQDSLALDAAANISKSYIALGQFDQADQIVSQLKQQDADNIAELLFDVAGAYRISNLDAKADACFEYVVNNFSDKRNASKSVAGLALRLAQAGDSVSAALTVERSGVDVKSMVASMDAIVKQNIRLGRYQQALDACDYIRANYSADYDRMQELGDKFRAYGGLGKHTDALVAAETLTQLQTDSNGRIRTLYIAIHDYRDLVSKKDKFVADQVIAATIDSMKENIDVCKSDCAVEDVLWTELELMRIRYCHQMGRYRQAVELSSELLVKFPDTLWIQDIYKHLIGNYTYLIKFEKATQQDIDDCKVLCESYLQSWPQGKYVNTAKVWMQKYGQ